MAILLLLAAFFGATGVGIGAFGAHGLADILAAHGRSATFSTGVLYHLIHTLAILGVAILGRTLDHGWLPYAAYAFAIGIVLFSGSLYILSIFDIRVMGAVAPLGGTAFIVGWLLLGIVAWQSA